LAFKGKPKEKILTNQKQEVTLVSFCGTKVGSCIMWKYFFGCYYESLYNKTKELNDSSLQHIGPLVFFVEIKNHLPGIYLSLLSTFWEHKSNKQILKK